MKFNFKLASAALALNSLTLHAWRAALVLVFGSIACAPSSSASATDSVVTDKLAAVVNQYGVDKKFAGVAWVQEGESVLVRQASGFANREKKVLHTVDERFRIASITKLFAATLVMKAVDEGLVKLDERVSKYGTELAAENARQITIRQLLQHTSGLPDPAGEDVKDDEIGAFYLTKSARYADPKFVIRERMKGVLGFTPGTKFKYNNGDYLVLQRVLEKVYKKPFAEILKAKIVAPLGLKNTGMLSNDNHQLKANKSQRAILKGYELVEGRLVPEPNIAIENFGAAGAMYSNASDVAEFALALIGGKLLSAESTHLMLTGNNKLGYVALGAWVFPLQLDPSKPTPNQTTAIPPAPQMLSREGEIGTFKLSLMVDTQRPRVIVLMTNQAPNPIGAVWMKEGLMYDLLKVWYQAE